MFPVSVVCAYVCVNVVCLSQFMSCKENNPEKLHLLTFELKHLVYVHIYLGFHCFNVLSLMDK